MASATASVSRKAQSVMQHIRTDQRAAVKLARESVNSFMRIDAMGLAKQVAFSVLFAALPTIFVLVSAAALMEHYFDIPVTREVRIFIFEQTPPESHIILLAGVDRAIADASTQLASFTAHLRNRAGALGRHGWCWRVDRSDQPRLWDTKYS